MAATTQISHSTRVRRTGAADVVVGMSPLESPPASGKTEAYLLAAALVHSLRVDLHRLPRPEEHLAGREAPRLADVGRPTDMHLDLAAGPPGLGVPGRELGGALDHLPRQILELLGVADDDVAARRSGHVQPQVVRLPHPEGEPVVLGVPL